MMKLTIAVFVILAVTVQGYPPYQNDIQAAALEQNWDQFNRLLADNFRQRNNFKPLFEDVKNVRPDQGGHVYAESEYTYQSSSNINGRESHQSGGHKIINNDGTITEYDIKP